jgi:uncharacterized membrane-anchored protein
MRNRLIIGLFLCLCFIQIAIPVSMIIKREIVLKNGRQFKFKTAPVDPYDAFRGRYVALQIKDNYAPFPRDTRLSYGEVIYALIDMDDKGFARFSAVTTTRPQQETYIQAKVQRISGDEVYLDLPIDRYYMGEKSAPLAEKIYQQNTQPDKQEAYVVVRVKDGLAVVESLYVKGQKIEDMVRHFAKTASWD